GSPPAWQTRRRPARPITADPADLRLGGSRRVGPDQAVVPVVLSRVIVAPRPAVARQPALEPVARALGHPQRGPIAGVDLQPEPGESHPVCPVDHQPYPQGGQPAAPLLRPHPVRQFRALRRVAHQAQHRQHPVAPQHPVGDLAALGGPLPQRRPRLLQRVRPDRSRTPERRPGLPRRRLHHQRRVRTRQGTQAQVARDQVHGHGDHLHTRRRYRGVRTYPRLAVPQAARRCPAPPGAQASRSTTLSRAAAYRSRIAATGSSSYRWTSPVSQAGGSSPPSTTQAACRAAPSATYSPGGGTSTGQPKTCGAIRRTASDAAPPPTRITRCAVAPWASIASSPSASAHSIPSTAARARCAGVAVRRVRPCTAPVASGRFGVRSPSRYGTSDNPSAPGGADRANRDSSSWSTPSRVAAASSTRAALSVHTSGRNRPVVSAKPATMPDGSAAGDSATEN